MYAAIEPVEAVGPELRVLLVEPDEQTGSLLELALSARGHSVTVGRSAADAVRVLTDIPFGVIVVDRRLPDADGFDFCRQLRSNPSCGLSTIIVIADSFDQDARDAAQAAGANDCLVWPTDAVLLRAYLDTAEASERPARIAHPLPPAEPIEASMVLGRDGTINAVDDDVVEWLRTNRSDLVGTSAFSLIHLDDASELLGLSTRAMGIDGPTAAVFARLRSGDDSWRRLRLRAVNRLNDPDVQGIVLLISPDTGAENAETSGDGLRDPATGLPSFPLFIDRLEHALVLAGRRGEAVVALAITFADTERLVRDHGDGVIGRLAHQAGERVQPCLRPGDTVGRLGGLEFGVILEGVERSSDAIAMAQRLATEFANDFDIDGSPVTLTPQVGIAVSWPGAGSADDVLHAARNTNRLADAVLTVHECATVVELGEPPVVSPPTADDVDVLVAEAPEQTPEPVSAVDQLIDDTAFWYAPLMDRIGVLEDEMSRLQARRQRRLSASSEPAA